MEGAEVSEGGRVRKMQIGDKVIKAPSFANYLSLTQLTLNGKGPVKI